MFEKETRRRTAIIADHYNSRLKTDQERYALLEFLLKTDPEYVGTIGKYVQKELKQRKGVKHDTLKIAKSLIVDQYLYINCN